MMEKIAKFLSSEGVLCLLVTFFFCSFVPTMAGLMVAIVLIAANLFYTNVLDVYKLVGFVVGWLLTIFLHWFY